MAKKTENSKSKPSTLALPSGFTAGGVAAGIKSGEKLDLGMILCKHAVVATGVFTTNRFRAAPVEASERRLLGVGRQIRGVIVNSGCANALTGEPGIEDAHAIANAAEREAGIPIGSLLMASTGVIGERPPVKKILKAIPGLVSGLSPDGLDRFSDSILTTDTGRKIASRKVDLPDGTTAEFVGIAKGAAMIGPNMATMLAFILTDAPIPGGKARHLLRAAVDVSFNRISVDGQTSTNDTVLLLGSKLLPRRHTQSAEMHEAILGGLRETCAELAMAIVRDGEGATKVLHVTVGGSNTEEQSRRLAKEIANSNLVKAAMHGCDPNWGRVVQALGQAGVPFLPSQVSVRMQGTLVLDKGLPVPFDRPGLAKALDAPDVTIEATVGGGKGRATMWTCDLSPEYVQLNMTYT